MKRLYVLCFLTLAAVFVDVAFFHSRTVSAQFRQPAPLSNTPLEAGPMTEYRVRDVGGVGVFRTSETVVGFSCTTVNDRPACFVVSK